MTTINELVSRIQKDFHEISSSIENNCSIIFLDLANSTLYKTIKGLNEGVYKAIAFNQTITNKFNNYCSDKKQAGIISEYSIVKYIGDEVMAFIIGDKSVDVCIDFAIDIQKYFAEINIHKIEDLDKSQAKITIDSGEVIFAQYSDTLSKDPQGLTVDRAARISKLTKSDQILISSSAFNKLNDKSKYKVSEICERSFKGISKTVGVQEIIYDEIIRGIESDVSTPELIHADPESVVKVINQLKLMKNYSTFDFFNYSLETFIIKLKQEIRHLIDGRTEKKDQKEFRILLRNPFIDQIKNQNIKMTIEHLNDLLSSITESLNIDNGVLIRVRFYDFEPHFRSYIFSNDNNKKEGILGFYKVSQHSQMLDYNSFENLDFTNMTDVQFVGAEGNRMISTTNDNKFGEYLLKIFQNRFNYMWSIASKPKAVIFDLDGVIIDSMENHFNAWNAAFGEFNIKITREVVYKYEGMKKEKFIQMILKREKRFFLKRRSMTDVIAKNKNNYFRDNFSLKKYDFIDNLIYQLKKKNITLGLVTGNTSLDNIFRDDKRFLNQFDVIVTGDECSNGKPHSEPYERAFHKLQSIESKLDKKNCIVIENAPLGVESASAAGMACLGLLNNSPLKKTDLMKHGATHVHQDVKSLFKMLYWFDMNISSEEMHRLFKNW